MVRTVNRAETTQAVAAVTDMAERSTLTWIVGAGLVAIVVMMTRGGGQDNQTGINPPQGLLGSIDNAFTGGPILPGAPVERLASGPFYQGPDPLNLGGGDGGGGGALYQGPDPFNLGGN